VRRGDLSDPPNADWGRPWWDGRAWWIYDRTPDAGAPGRWYKIDWRDTHDHGECMTYADKEDCPATLLQR
jgi:hypothetical protein